MRECDRCGRKIKYGTLCHDCDIYLKSYMLGKREGRMVGAEEERERIIRELEEKLKDETLGSAISDVGVGIKIALKIVRGGE